MGAGWRGATREPATPGGQARWAAMDGDDYLRWAARFLWSGPPRASLRRRFPALQGAEDDILNSCYLALTTTAANKRGRQEHFSFTGEDHAEAFTNLALRNAALQALRARGRLPASTSLDALTDFDAWATPNASTTAVSIAGSTATGPLPDDPQAVLDRVQVAVRDAVLTDDRYDCPSCGQGDLVNLTLGVVEEARDQLDEMLAPVSDTEYHDDVFDRITRTTPASQSVYRAMARAKGDDYVFTTPEAGTVTGARAANIQDRARALLRRCRPCIERILDEVIAWVGIAPEDWTGGPEGSQPGGGRR